MVGGDEAGGLTGCWFLVARCWLLVEQITKGGWMKSYKDLDIYKLSFQLA